MAHEFSHILNGDMRLNLRLLGWTFGLLAVAIVARIVLQTSPRTGGREPASDGAAALMLAALAVMILGYIGVFFGRLLQAAVSRHRERLADASAVQFTRDPAGLSGRAAQDRRRQRRLEAGDARSRRSGAHVVCLGPVAFVRHASVDRRAAQFARSLVSRQRAAGLAAAAARDAQRQRQADTAVRRRARPSRRARRRAAPCRWPRWPAKRRPSRHRPARWPTSRCVTPRTLAGQHPGAAARFRRLRRSRARADPGRAGEQGAGRAACPAPHSRTAYGPEVTAQVFAQQGLADSLAPALRLPAVQQLFPALRRLTLAERQKLRDVVNALANCPMRASTCSSAA